MGLPEVVNSFLADANLPVLVGSSLSSIATTYISFRFGALSSINNQKHAIIYEMLDKDNLNLSPLEVAKCKNIMDIARLAQSYRKSPSTNSTEFSFEWFDRFFDAASMVSDEEMKTIWAKILNEESNQKGKYSFRFIESMKLLSQSEAEIFCRLSRLALKEPDGSLYIYAPSNSQIEIYEEFGITDIDFLLMEECGLINVGVIQKHDIDLDPELCNGFYNGDIFVRFYSDTLSDEMAFKFESYPLTRFGQQIYDLIEDTASREFIFKLAEDIQTSIEKDLIVSIHPISEYDSDDIIVDTDIELSLK